MTESQKTLRTERLGRALWQGSKKAALFVLIASVLLIPRLGRLRRKVWVWTLIRLAAILAGAWSAWRFSRGNTGASYLLGALALCAFGLLARARPKTKSVDALARDLNALVVLNGGTFIPGMAREPSRDARVFVNADRLFVLDSQDRPLTEIPLARVRHLRALPASIGGGTATAGQPWELEITWESENVQKAVFRFGGFFAEHLARVAETTLQSLLKRDLPVLRP